MGLKSGIVADVQNVEGDLEQRIHGNDVAFKLRLVSLR